MLAPPLVTNLKCDSNTLGLPHKAQLKEVEIERPRAEILRMETAWGHFLSGPPFDPAYQDLEMWSMLRFLDLNRWDFDGYQTDDMSPFPPPPRRQK